jgi:signal recognition particle subunit SRP19
MRKQEKVIIWPAYFDSTKTRKEGRRVPKSLAVPSPKILEIKDAAEKIGLEHELALDVGYPKTPFLPKTGMLLIKKNEAKQKVVVKIAKQLLKIRGAAATTK